MAAHDPVEAIILREIKRAPILDRDANNELARIIAAGGAAGERARKDMIAGNMRLVLHVARRYADSHLSLTDRIQEGAIGLMRAIHKFDPDRGVAFVTYATFWIRAAIERAFYTMAYTITVPCNVALALHRIRKIEHTTQQSLSNEEAADLLQMGRLSLEAARLMPTHMVPLDAPLMHADGDGDMLLAEVVRDEDAAPPEESVVFADIWHLVNRCDTISERDKIVLGMFAFGETYQSIADELGFSRERSRQIILAALKAVRRFMNR